MVLLHLRSKESNPGNTVCGLSVASYGCVVCSTKQRLCKHCFHESIRLTLDHGAKLEGVFLDFQPKG